MCNRLLVEKTGRYCYSKYENTVKTKSFIRIDIRILVPAMFSIQTIGIRHSYFARSATVIQKIVTQHGCHAKLIFQRNANSRNYVLTCFTHYDP